MSEIKVCCPHCKQHILCDESHRGTQLVCPTCNKVMRVPIVQEQPTVSFPKTALKTRLSLENRFFADNPTPDDIAHALASLDCETNTFAILERDETHFMQTARLAGAAFQLEYRDGEDDHNHYECSTTVSTTEAIVAFQSYARGDNEWHSCHNWQREETSSVLLELENEKRNPKSNRTSDIITVSCPHCKQHIQCDARKRGTQINCPTCNKPFEIVNSLLVNENTPEVPLPAEQVRTQPNIGDKPWSSPNRIEKKNRFGWMSTAVVVALAIYSWHNWTTIRGALYKETAIQREVNVTGTLYVKLSSGENVRLSMITVAAYDEQYLSYRGTQVTLDVAQADVNVQFGLNAIRNSWNGATSTAQTDIDGKFQFRLPHSGNFAFFAYAKRQTPLWNEPYLFFKRVKFEDAGDCTIEINNNDEEISAYTSDWGEEYKTMKFNETSDFTWQRDMLVRIMRANYGLQVLQDP